MIASTGCQGSSTSSSEAAAGTDIFADIAGEVVVPSIFIDREPANARATSAEASGCWVLEPKPPISSAITRVQKPMPAPAIR